MAWWRVNLTDEEQRMVNEQRDSRPDPHVRRHMLVLWSLHGGLKRRELSAVERVGINERNFGRAQDHVSLMTDLNQKRVPDVVPGRNVQAANKLWETCRLRSKSR